MFVGADDPVRPYERWRIWNPPLRNNLRIEVKILLKIRLKRMGGHKNPFYRIVVADARVQRDGASVEEIGYYDALKKPADIKLDAEAARKWLGNGAKPTDTVRNIFKKAGVI